MFIIPMYVYVRIIYEERDIDDAISIGFVLFFLRVLFSFRHAHDKMIKLEKIQLLNRFVDFRSLTTVVG